MSLQQFNMQRKIRSLIIYFIIYYLITHSLESVSNLIHGQKLSRWSWIGTGIDLSTFISFLLDAILSYLLFFYSFKRNGAIATLLIFLFLTIPLLIATRYFLQEVLGFWILGVHNYGIQMLTAAKYFLDNVWYALFYGTFGIIYFFIQYSWYNQFQQKKMEFQMVDTELQLLRSQINPHFLFNNLNNIYSLVYHNSENSLAAINKLSELLRYSLYEKDPKVLLSKELEYVQNYIDLQLMRFDYKPCLKLALDVDDRSLVIAPFTLMPFVENAFKHGDLKDGEYPVRIAIKADHNQLCFEVFNKKNHHKNKSPGGIGLENIKRRLELIYKEAHQLTINESAHSFIIKLTINLK
ncbi:MAG: histidine kinase [Mucilaginibacter sp.]|nr:histidine kinase [Mucilaginibacter sp.]